MKECRRSLFFRLVFYVSGMILLAAGLTLNTKLDLGVSPIISIASAGSEITGISFGNAAFILYSVLVLIEICIHLREKKFSHLIPDLLQLVISVFFTRFLCMFDFLIPDFCTELSGTVFETLWMRLIFLAAAIIITGTGGAMSMNARIVPNPGDGFVLSVSDALHKSTGFIKNCVDIACVITAAAVSLLAAGEVYGVGAGTLAAMIGVGRIMALYNRCFKSATDRLSGLEKIS